MKFWVMAVPIREKKKDDSISIPVEWLSWTDEAVFMLNLGIVSV